MPVIASAPGKVILLGEHFVVRGSRALAASIGLRVQVEIVPRREWPSIIESETLSAMALVEDDLELRGSRELEPLRAVLSKILSMGYRLSPFKAVIRGDLPPGAGLGSSAAVSAAFALAYTALLGSPLSREELVEAAYAGEEVVHGNPSGVDSAIAVYGGFILYRRGEGPSGLEASLPPSTKLVVADTGVKRKTGDVVKFVLERAEATRPASDLVYRAADIIVDEALASMANGNAARLGALMDLAHGLLAGLGASSPEIEALVHAARRAGAYGAKLTGAGWGGSVIALAPEEAADRIADALLSAGARWARAVELGVTGARLDQG